MISREICEQARKARDPRFDGAFFVLVKTTKIFCRNICTVRLPLERNVSYAENAAMAIQLGYRPCLKCRPDSAPNSPAWKGKRTSVERAMRLLSACDSQSIESIAQRLGVSTRYLNKLFSDTLAISPKRYQLFQQLLMAKKLLHQTHLSVEAVATMVGFANARQLQQHCKTHIRLSPSQIRKQTMSSKPTSEQSLHALIELFQSYRPPYDWQQISQFWSARIIEQNEWIEGDHFKKIFNINGVGVLVQLEHCEQKQGFYIRFDGAFSQYSIDIINAVKRMFDLDADPNTINKALVNAGLPQHMHNEGTRIPGVASVFEAGCRAILGQQVSVKAAINKLNQLQQHFCQEQPSMFVSAKQVAESDLAFFALPQSRKNALVAFARYCLEHKLDSCDQIEIDEQALLAIKGIGPWTLAYIKLRALSDCNMWLDGDLIIKKQMANLEQQLTPLEADKAQPWRSYLSLNLWGAYDQQKR